MMTKSYCVDMFCVCGYVRERERERERGRERDLCDYINMDKYYHIAYMGYLVLGWWRKKNVGSGSANKPINWQKYFKKIKKNKDVYIQNKYMCMIESM